MSFRSENNLFNTCPTCPSYHLSAALFKHFYFYFYLFCLWYVDHCFTNRDGLVTKMTSHKFCCEKPTMHFTWKVKTEPFCQWPNTYWSRFGSKYGIIFIHRGGGGGGGGWNASFIETIACPPRQRKPLANWRQWAQVKSMTQKFDRNWQECRQKRTPVQVTGRSPALPVHPLIARWLWHVQWSC